MSFVLRPAGGSEEGGGMSTTLIVNARLELLRSLADCEDFSQWRIEQMKAEGRDPACWPTHAPLFIGPFENGEDDILIAAKEAAANGDILFNDRGQHPNGPMVRVTPKGYAWIRAHDLIGEMEQEDTNV
jgi:hypothetical protein